MTFEARNRGDITAAQMRIVATLAIKDSEPEEHEATIDFLPPQSMRRGGFFFQHNPRNGGLDVDRTVTAIPERISSDPQSDTDQTRRRLRWSHRSTLRPANLRQAKQR